MNRSEIECGTTTRSSFSAMMISRQQHIELSACTSGGMSLPHMASLSTLATMILGMVSPRGSGGTGRHRVGNRGFAGVGQLDELGEDVLPLDVRGAAGDERAERVPDTAGDRSRLVSAVAEDL